MELIAEGKMKPVIDKVLPLEQARRGPAPDPGPRGVRQGRRDAVTAWHTAQPHSGAGRKRNPESCSRMMDSGFAAEAAPE